MAELNVTAPWGQDGWARLGCLRADVWVHLGQDVQSTHVDLSDVEQHLQET